MLVLFHQQALTIDKSQFILSNNSVVCFYEQPAHVALGTTGKNKLESTIRDLKSYTSRQIRIYVQNNPQESRKQCLPTRSRFGKGRDARNDEKSR